MSINDGIITYPVNQADVQIALGTDATSWSELCTHGNLNAWAKFRPIEYHNPNGSRHVQALTIAERASVNWGMKNIPIWTNKTIGHVVNCWIDGSTDAVNAPDCGIQSEYWDIDRPTTAYRITDFVDSTNNTLGYFVNAAAPITGLKEISKSGSVVTILFSMNLGGVYSGHTLWYGNFTQMSQASFKNLYFGVLIKAGSQVFLATQDNTVGDLGTSSGTLWSIGAHARFKLGSGSGDLLTCANSYTPIEFFPIMSSVKNYVESTVITPINEAQTSGTFVAIWPKDEAVIPGVATVSGDIVIFNAFKDNTSNPRHNLRICYNLRVVASDNGTHYFNVKLEALNSSGTVTGDVNDALNVSSPYAPQPSQSQIDLGYSSPFIDINYSTAGVTHLRVTVTKGSSDTSANFQTTTMTVPVLNDITPY